MDNPQQKPIVVSKQKVVIVTGTCSGIGNALTRNFLAEGWKVAGFDLQDAQGHALEGELGLENFKFVPCDVSNYRDQAYAFQEVFNEWGRIDALCANAGIIDQSSIYIFGHRGSRAIPPAPNLSCTDIDYKAIVYGTQLAIHFMRQNPTPGGSICCTASSVGVHPIATFPEYCGAKAGVINFAKSAAPILKLHENITINVICPGVVPTNAIPQQMRDAFGPEYMTPLSNITSTYLRLLTDPSLTAQIIECSHTRAHTLPEPPWSDGDVLRKSSKVYEPFFEYLHGKKSGLEDTIDISLKEGEVGFGVGGGLAGAGAARIEGDEKVRGELAGGGEEKVAEPGTGADAAAAVAPAPAATDDAPSAVDAVTATEEVPAASKAIDDATPTLAPAADTAATAPIPAGDATAPPSTSTGPPLATDAKVDTEETVPAPATTAPATTTASDGATTETPAKDTAEQKGEEKGSTSTIKKLMDKIADLKT